MSNFKKDLALERCLYPFLDEAYSSKGLYFERVDDISSQLKGIDLIFRQRNTSYYIDEKAQLHYINTELPTFTFELDFLVEERPRTGWLIDQHKITTHYFLITGIYAKTGKDISKGVRKLKVTSVNRKKLLFYLVTLGLDFERLTHYANELRQSKKNGKTAIKELSKAQGCLFASSKYVEYPINLQLRLEHLIAKGIAKQIYP